jgi:hypothetical protein
MYHLSPKKYIFKKTEAQNCRKEYFIETVSQLTWSKV